MIGAERVLIRQSIPSPQLDPTAGTHCVGGVLSPLLSLGHRQWLAAIGQQLLGHLIEADLGAFRIVGSGVDVEDVLHVPDELGILLGWNAPLLLQMRGQLVF